MKPTSVHTQATKQQKTQMCHSAKLYLSKYFKQRPIWQFHSFLNFKRDLGTNGTARWSSNLHQSLQGNVITLFLLVRTQTILPIIHIVRRMSYSSQNGKASGCSFSPNPPVLLLDALPYHLPLQPSDWETTLDPPFPFSFYFRCLCIETISKWSTEDDT